MSNNLLDFLTNLLIAQAQEMVIFKAITERMKNAVISKLCSQSESSYDNLKKARRYLELVVAVCRMLTLKC